MQTIRTSFTPRIMVNNQIPFECTLKIYKRIREINSWRISKGKSIIWVELQD
jgi:hypothetical protein